jgi:hypothetical protein
MFYSNLPVEIARTSESLNHQNQQSKTTQFKHQGVAPKSRKELKTSRCMGRSTALPTAVIKRPPAEQKLSNKSSA